MTWKSIKYAPTDGTVIEFNDSTLVQYTDKGWNHVHEPSMYTTELTDGYDKLEWRTYDGDTDSYYNRNDTWVYFSVDDESSQPEHGQDIEVQMRSNTRIDCYCMGSQLYDADDKLIASRQVSKWRPRVT